LVAAGEVGEVPVPEPGLRIVRGTSRSWQVVTISGDLDLTGIPATERAVGEALDAEPEGIVLDLTGLTFLGSEGVRALLRARERADEEGRGWRLVAGKGSARRLIELLELGSRLGLEEAG
jgi:anti-anti-sigma factor